MRSRLVTRLSSPCNPVLTSSVFANRCWSAPESLAKPSFTVLISVPKTSWACLAWFEALHASPNDIPDKAPRRTMAIISHVGVLTRTAYLNLLSSVIFIPPQQETILILLYNDLLQIIDC